MMLKFVSRMKPALAAGLPLVTHSFYYKPVACMEHLVPPKQVASANSAKEFGPTCTGITGQGGRSQQGEEVSLPGTRQPAKAAMAKGVIVRAISEAYHHSVETFNRSRTAAVAFEEAVSESGAAEPITYLMLCLRAFEGRFSRR